jgi:outer membrane receptor protein involved in Fe transport
VVDIPMGRDASLAVRGDWRYLSSIYFDLPNTIKNDGYGLLGATVTLRTRRLDVSAFGANLGDKRYIGYGFAFGAPFVMLGPPRTLGLSVTARPWR